MAYLLNTNLTNHLTMQIIIFILALFNIGYTIMNYYQLAIVQQHVIKPLIISNLILSIIIALLICYIN
jgi:hypothetical protein